MADRTAPSAIIVGDTTLPVSCGEILAEEGFSLTAVITDDDVVHRWAKSANVPCLAPDASPESLEPLGADYLFSINNLRILPASVVGLARRAAINFHDGPLPEYAGLNTPTWAILNGEPKHAVTWHVMTEGIDEGPVLAREEIAIAADETSLTLNTKCYEAAIGSFRPLVRALAAGALTGTEQDLSRRRYFGRDARPGSACVFTWSSSAEELERMVRALDLGAYPNPLGCAKVLVGDDALIVTRLEATTVHSSAEPGTIVDHDEDRLRISTGSFDVDVSGLRDQSGATVTAAETALRYELARGSRLPQPSLEEATQLGAVHESSSSAEAFWRGRLASLTPLTLPTIVGTRAAEGAGRKVHSGEPLAASIVGSLEAAFPGAAVGDLLVGVLAAFLGRAGAQESFDIAYAEAEALERTGPARAVLPMHVPAHVPLSLDRPARDALVAVLDELRTIRSRGTHLRDLVARSPDVAQDADAMPVAIWQRRVDAVDPASVPALLTLLVDPETADISWRFDEEQVSNDAVAALHRELAAFAAALSADLERPLGEIDLLPSDELHRLLVEWNATAAEFADDACLHDLIASQAGRTPDRLAVACNGVELTYEELELHANGLSHVLVGRGVGPGTRVGICLQRSVEMVVGLLAVLKAGGAYVPLDPTYPSARLAHMVTDAEPVVVLAERETVHLLPRDCAVLLVDGDPVADTPAPAEPPVTGVQPADPAYVIYTSGSTGVPKGVVVSHRNVVSFMHAMDERVDHRDGDVLVAVTSISFDISVLELFWTLARGLSVVVYAGREEAPSTRVSPARTLDFSLFFFASDDSEQGAQVRYRLLVEAARHADRAGYRAIWTPERHFHAFGGLFPNPSVTSAVLAGITEQIQIRAGSVVAPLHNAARIAEEWSFVDNISGGRVGISFASGWQPDDFVLAPGNFANRKDLMAQQIETVRRLWRGDSVVMDGPNGPVDVRIMPRPVQEELPVWITAAGNPETFELAGANGYGVLTHLLGQSSSELGDKIQVYRDARRAAGFDPRGNVVVMLHTFVGPDADSVRESVREPLKAYLQSSVQLIQRAAWTFPTFRQATTADDGSFSLDNLSAEDLDAVLDFSFERYYETSGLLGTPDKCLALLEEMAAIGVDEIACLIDFHHDVDAVLEHLPHLDAVRERSRATRPRLDSDLSIPGLIERYGVTHMQCTPSLATMLASTDEGAEALGRLRVLLIGGEPFPAALGERLRAMTTASLVNMYGPTETTIWSSTYEVNGAGDAIPIGRPIANTRFYVLDDQRRPVPTGTPGELYIGGAGVAVGYHDRPELTAERFVPDPFNGEPGSRLYRTGDLVRYRRDGNVEFLGRLDHQVKIRGYRVEVGEVETVLGRHPSVREAVVVASAVSGNGANELVAYVVGRPGSELSAEELRSHLRASVPEFMIPSAFEFLAAMPRTPNGKISRDRLPAPGSISVERTTAAVRPPRDDLERVLVDIWSAELGNRAIGVEDDFFLLGGHSLLAMRVFARIEERLGVRLPLATLFRAPTVAALANAVRPLAKAQPRESDAWHSLVPIQSKGSNPPLFLVHAHGGHVLFYTDLARHLGPDQPVYGLQAHGVDGVREPLERIEEMAAAYLQEVRAAHPRGPYRLGGDCLGGVVAYEMAQQLRAAGEEVDLVAMFDSFHPRYRPYVPSSLYQTVHYAQLIVRFHLPNLVRLPWSEKLGYVRTKGARAVTQLGSHVVRPVGRKSHVGEADPLARTQTALSNAFDRYEPKPYPGQVLLFRASHQPLGVRRDPLLGWGGLTPNIEAHEVPAYFTCTALEPNAAGLASRLAASIDALDAADLGGVEPIPRRVAG